MVFFRRTQSDDDPWLREKVWIFTAGAVVALLGMLNDRTWVIGLGALILASGVVLRFLPRREDKENAPDSDNIPDPDSDLQDPDR